MDNQSGNIGTGWRIRSKVLVPQLQIELVHRQRLLQLLDANAQKRLLLITAPAGFGKTTLLAQWLKEGASQEIKTVWLSIDEDDSELKQFFSYLLFALTEADIDLGDLGITASQGAIDVPAKRVIGTIAEALDIAGPTCIVLDDYYRAESESLNHAVDSLLSALPPHCQLVINTRYKPGIRLSNLRLQGQLFELGEAELRFTAPEVESLFSDRLPPDQCADLLARTEGWVAALQLARIWGESLNRLDALSRFSGRSRDLGDYLAEQVVSELSGEEKAFLIETAFLEEVRTDLADHVRGRNDSRYLLGSLSRLNPLIAPVDDLHSSYHYHQLFRDFLCQLMMEQGEEVLRKLRLRAATWYEQHGTILNAVRYACQAEDYECAAGYIYQAGGWKLCMLYGEALMKNLLKLFPDEVIQSQPELQVYTVYSLIKEGRLREARGVFDRLAANLEGREAPVNRQGLEIMEMILSLYEDRSINQGAPKKLQTAINALPEEAHDIRAIMYTCLFVQLLSLGRITEARDVAVPAIQYLRSTQTLYALDYFYYHLGVANLLMGEVKEAQANYQEGVRFAQENFGGLSGLVAVGQLLLTETHYLFNELEESQTLLVASLETVSSQDGWFEVFAPGYITSVRVTYILQGLDAAQDLIGKGRATATERHVHRLAVLMEVLMAEMLARQGNYGGARTHLVENVFTQLPNQWETNPFYWQIRHLIASVRLRCAIAQKKYAEAETVLTAARQTCPAALYSCELELWQALLNYQRNDTQKAVDQVNAVVSDIMQQGSVRLFLDLGESIAPLARVALQRAQERMLGSRHASFLSQVIAGLSHASDVREEASANALLSHREYEVLVALEQGGSNKVIARQLDMTENTVKFHLKKIYKKLGVEKRMAAVKAAKAQGILP